MEVALPDISNRVGSVKAFLNELLRALRRGESFFSFLSLCIDDHGSFVISQSVSVRPKHLFDQNFDHDYFFKLPLSGSGMPIQVHSVLLTPCPVPSSPVYEPNSNDDEYSHPFRHIQYKRTPACVPSLPWQCSCAAAWPGECIVVSTPHCYAPPFGLLPPTRNATTNCLAC